MRIGIRDKKDGSMIIGAASTLEAKPRLERTALASQTPAVADAPFDPLAQLEDFVESAARSRKAFAEDRLKFLNEQMTKLSLFNLAPGFLVDHTARMARELESAAEDFAGSFKVLGEPRPSASQEATTTVPQSYLDVMNTDIGSGFVLSKEDSETAQTFMNTADQLRHIVELASSEQDERKDVWGSADSARNSTSRVSDMMVRLEGPATFSKSYW